MSATIVGQTAAIGASTRAHYYANRGRTVIIRAPYVNEPLVRFAAQSLPNGVSFYAFVSTEGEPVECGIGDDDAEALTELYEQLVARL
jgi:hypothetical protein